MANNTFLGLQPYTEEDAYRFKGRTEESQDLFRLIVRNDFTVCYAESGEGKTSLLNAGVFPLLRENMYFPISITFTNDDYKVTPDSFDKIIDRCIRDSITEYNEKNKGVNVEYKPCGSDFLDMECQQQLQEELSKYSWWKLRNYKPQAMGLIFIPVFVFDQFEEVFSMSGSIVWTKAFFGWLEEVSSDSCPDKIAQIVRSVIGSDAAFPVIKEEKEFKAIFSLRKEFIGELDYWGMQKFFIPSLKNNRYCLKALTYDGAKKVMTQQARFEETKVDQILTYFVGQYSREPERTIEEDLPIIPALLLSVVSETWEKDIDSFSKMNAPEIEKSLNKIIGRFFNDAIDNVIKDVRSRGLNQYADTCRRDLDAIVFALVDGNGKRVRRKSTSSRLREVCFEAKYKQTLCEHRIIKVTKVDGEDYVELVHDVLCPVISKKKERVIAEKAKAQEEVIRWEQSHKMQKRMNLIILIGSLIIGVMAAFIWQNKRNLEMERNLNSKLQENDRIRHEKELAQNTLSLTEAQRQKIENYWNLAEIQKDSIKRQNIQMRKLNDSISKLNESLYSKMDVMSGEKDSVDRLLKISRFEQQVLSQQVIELDGFKRPTSDSIVVLLKKREYNKAIKACKSDEVYKIRQGKKLEATDYSLYVRTYYTILTDSLLTETTREKAFFSLDSICEIAALRTPKYTGQLYSISLNYLLSYLLHEGRDISYKGLLGKNALRAVNKNLEYQKKLRKNEIQEKDYYYLMESYYYLMEYYLFSDSYEDAYKTSEKILNMPPLSEMFSLTKEQINVYDHWLSRAEQINKVFRRHYSRKREH